MGDDLKADKAKIAKFLEAVHPAPPWVLTAIWPEKAERRRTHTETFHDVSAAAGWAELMNADHNVYFTVNRVRGSMNIKPKKEHIEEAVFLHVDLDPRKPRSDMRVDELAGWNEEERSRILAELEAFDPRPTIVVDSGGGYQALFRLDAAMYVGGDLTRAAEVEAYNRQLGIVLKGDNTQNVDRILRVAGTVNWPDATKKAKGRKARRAASVWTDGPVHPLHDFSPAVAEDTQPAGGASVALPAAAALSSTLHA